MAPLRRDPRIRQTLNQISQNLESANLTTQASIFTFSERFISPCLSSVQSYLSASCIPCLTFLYPRENDPRHRQSHHRNGRRGREELSFDFYDDWDDEEGEWGNDELDRLLAGSDSAEQPGKRAGMSYGSRGGNRMGLPKDEGAESIVPSSSMFGFLERLPWKIGGRGMKYRPSAADLQENVGRWRGEGEPLMEESEESSGRPHRRNRSGTTSTGSTTNSLSSRGDLFPSEDEDDAVPLDDEFAMVLERRNTGTGLDDNSSRRTRGKRPSDSRTSTRTGSSKDTKKAERKPRRGSTPSTKVPAGVAEAEEDVPSMIDLKQEEERVRREEEASIEANREAAQRLALERGLNTNGDVGSGCFMLRAAVTILTYLNRLNRMNPSSLLHLLRKK